MNLPRYFIDNDNLGGVGTIRWANNPFVNPGVCKGAIFTSIREQYLAVGRSLLMLLLLWLEMLSSSLLMGNSGSPSVVEQSQQGCGF